MLRVQVEEQRKNVLIAATKCEKMLQGIEQCMLLSFFLLQFHLLIYIFSIIYFNTKRLTEHFRYIYICTNVHKR